MTLRLGFIFWLALGTSVGAAADSLSLAQRSEALELIKDVTLARVQDSLEYLRDFPRIRERDRVTRLFLERFDSDGLQPSHEAYVFFASRLRDVFQIGGSDPLFTAEELESIRGSLPKAGPDPIVAEKVRRWLNTPRTPVDCRVEKPAFLAAGVPLRARPPGLAPKISLDLADRSLSPEQQLRGAVELLTLAPSGRKIVALLLPALAASQLQVVFQTEESLIANADVGGMIAASYRGEPGLETMHYFAGFELGFQAPALFHEAFHWADVNLRRHLEILKARAKDLNLALSARMVRLARGELFELAEIDQMAADGKQLLAHMQQNSFEAEGGAHAATARLLEELEAANPCLRRFIEIRRAQIFEKQGFAFESMTTVGQLLEGHGLDPALLGALQAGTIPRLAGF